MSTEQSMGINEDKAAESPPASSPKAAPTAGGVTAPGVSGWSFDEQWMTESQSEYPHWCALRGPDNVSVTGHCGREIGQLFLDALDVRHATGFTPRQLADQLRDANQALIRSNEHVAVRDELVAALAKNAEALKAAQNDQETLEYWAHSGEDLSECKKRLIWEARKATEAVLAKVQP